MAQEDFLENDVLGMTTLEKRCRITEDILRKYLIENFPEMIVAKKIEIFDPIKRCYADCR